MKVRQTTENIKMVYTANELLRSEFQIEWLVPEVLVAKTINFISAESGIGKSRLSMQLGKALATGTQFLKWPIPRQISCMYLSLEMQGDMLKHFLESLLQNKEMEDSESDKFMLVPVGKAIDVSTPEGLAYIEMFVKEYKPEVLMIDAMGKLAFDELGETQAKGINNAMNYLISEYGVTILMIHHNRKPDLTGKKRPGLGDVYGNQYVVTDASTVMTMFMPENQAHVELIFIKSRASMAQDSIVMNGKKGFSFIIREGVEPDGPDSDSEPKLRY
jgi:RecA-family ATPase